MLARSVRNPLIIGVGTGLVLVSGTAPAALADTTSPTPTPSTVTSPSATPSNSPSTTADPSTPTSTSPGGPTSSPPETTTPPPIALKVEVERKSTGAIHAGTKVELIAHVSTELDTVHSVKLSISATPKEDVSDIDAKCVLSAGLCELGDLTKATVKEVDFTLTVSSKMTSGTIKVSTDALSTPDNADATPTPYALKVTKAPKPKPKPSATHSSSSSSSNSSSSSGSSTSSGSSLPVGGTSNAGGTANNTPNSSTVLPSIAPQQTQAPATAPVQDTGNSQQMRGTNASADELTFDRLASTQAAWLAALLVAFSLLLTQIRLGRVGAGTPKRKGAHRRTRRPGSAH